MKLFPNAVSRLLTEWLPHQNQQWQDCKKALSVTGRTKYCKRTNDTKEVSAIIFPLMSLYLIQWKQTWNCSIHMLHVTYVICSLDMSWDQLPHYIIKLQCQVTLIKSDGFCFLCTVSMILHMDHDEVVTLVNMESSILDHIVSNVNYYKLFHTGHVLWDTQRYFKFGMSCENVLDLIVVAMARALNLNLTIYQKGPTGNI